MDLGSAYREVQKPSRVNGKSVEFLAETREVFWKAPRKWQTANVFLGNWRDDKIRENTTKE
jgi:hypothetical protein